MKEVWIGDTVSVPGGQGNVLNVERWREKVLGMSEQAAKTFSETCSREVGLEFRDTWGMVLVDVGGSCKWWPIADVQVLEGRDVKTK